MNEYDPNQDLANALKDAYKSLQAFINGQRFVIDELLHEFNDMQYASVQDIEDWNGRMDAAQSRLLYYTKKIADLVLIYESAGIEPPADSGMISTEQWVTDDIKVVVSYPRNTNGGV